MKAKTFAIDRWSYLSYKKNDYRDSKPNISAINKVNKLYERGNKIIIFTARYMGKA